MEIRNLGDGNVAMVLTLSQLITIEQCVAATVDGGVDPKDFQSVIGKAQSEVAEIWAELQKGRIIVQEKSVKGNE